MKGTTRGPALDLGNINSISISLVFRVSLENVVSSHTVASITSLLSTLLVYLLASNFYWFDSTVVLGLLLLPFLTITEGAFVCSSFQSCSSILDFLRWSLRVLKVLPSSSKRSDYWCFFNGFLSGDSGSSGSKIVGTDFRCSSSSLRYLFCLVRHPPMQPDTCPIKAIK